MPIEIAMRVSGFLYLYILASYIPLAIFGYQIGWGDYDSDTILQRINNHPTNFYISIVIALIEHASIIALAVLLFIAFGPLSLILAIVLTTFRIGEGLIAFYNEKSYWGLVKIARQYASTSDVEKNALSDLALNILETRDFRWNIMHLIFWPIGTLAFSIVLVTSGVVPPFIGWLGIIAALVSIPVSGIKLAEYDNKVLFGISGLLGISFEIIIGVWLLFYSSSIP